MTNQEKIKYLKQYINLVKECDELLEHCRTKAYNIQAQTITDMPVTFGNAGDVVGSKLARIDTIEEIIARELHKFGSVRNHIRDLINGVEDTFLRRLLRLRYMDGYKWENICVEIGLTWKYTHRQHVKALEQIKL